MKKFLMLPLLAFALFACESNETENQTSFNEVEGLVSQSNLWDGSIDPDTVTFTAEVTDIIDWDGVVVRYTTKESYDTEEGTRWKEVETETGILELDDTAEIIEAFINPDNDYDSIQYDLIPYKVINDEEGQLYEDAVEELSTSNASNLEGIIYSVRLRASYQEYLDSIDD